MLYNDLYYQINYQYHFRYLLFYIKLDTYFCFFFSSEYFHYRSIHFNVCKDWYLMTDSFYYLTEIYQYGLLTYTSVAKSLTWLSEHFFSFLYPYCKPCITVSLFLPDIISVKILLFLLLDKPSKIFSTSLWPNIFSYKSLYLSL